MNKLSKNILTDNIIDLNRLIYVGAKLVCAEIGVFPKEHEQKVKTWMRN